MFDCAYRIVFNWKTCFRKNEPISLRRMTTQMKRIFFSPCASESFRTTRLLIEALGEKCQMPNEWTECFHLLFRLRMFCFHLFRSWSKTLQVFEAPVLAGQEFLPLNRCYLNLYLWDCWRYVIAVDVCKSTARMAITRQTESERRGAPVP